jgi:hypothetical protein
MDSRPGLDLTFLVSWSAVDERRASRGGPLAAAPSHHPDGERPPTRANASSGEFWRAAVTRRRRRPWAAVCLRTPDCVCSAAHAIKTAAGPLTNRRPTQPARARSSRPADLADAQALRGVSVGWPAVFANLKSFLENGRPLPQAPWELHSEMRAAQLITLKRGIAGLRPGIPA